MATLKDLTEATEFFVPNEGLDLQHYLDQTLPADASPKTVRLRKQAVHHLARYYWAARVLSKRAPGTILDVACGSGYGSAILARALPNFVVIGGDYDPRAVEYARASYGTLPNLRYGTADIVTWTDGKEGENIGGFDYIVSFDTLEHILHREIAVINLAENLSPGGALLFSTPAKKENLLNPGWEHHKIEYSYKYLFNFMKRFFEDVAIPDNGDFPEINFWTETVNRQNQEYLLRGNPMVCQRPIALGLGWPPLAYLSHS